MDDGVYIRARRGDISFDPDVVRLYAYRRQLRRRWYTNKLEFVELTGEERQTTLQPFLEIEMHEAQGLMDSLWDCGLRPSEGAGSAGAFKALQNHLTDLKEILFHVMKISKK